MTQKTLAFKSGIGIASIGRIERGQVDPQWTSIRAIAVGLGITPRELVLAAEDAEGGGATQAAGAAWGGVVESSQEFIARITGQEAPMVRLPWTTYADTHDKLGVGANMSLTRIAAGRMLVAYFFPTETEKDPNTDTMHHAFRDRLDDFERLKVRVVGVSAQTALAQQQREKTELELLPLDVGYPELLSDTDMELAGELALPTVETDGHGEYEPLTIIFDADRIVHVVYPIESPRAHIDGVLDWLTQREG